MPRKMKRVDHTRSTSGPKPGNLNMLWDERIHLEDAKGHRYKRNGSGSSQNGNNYYVQYYYPKSDDQNLQGRR